MPQISIIIPCYNQGQYLPETLDSVLAQTTSDWECVIINDGSSDNTEEVAQNYCDRDSRFIYVYQENQGVVEARNNAIRHSHGKFILPLDGDDLISPQFAEKAADVLENDKDVKIVYCEVEYFGDRTGNMKLPDFSISTMLRANCFTNTSMYRRTDFEQVGGYNPNMKDGYEDWDFWLSILESGGRTHKLNFVGLHYRINNDTSRNRKARALKDALHKQMFLNHPTLYYEDYARIRQENKQIKQKYEEIVRSRLYPYFNNIRKIMRKFKGR